MATFLGAIGVPHYTKDGKLYTGEMHKDASGRLMTGKFHTANSRFLFHTKYGVDGIKGFKGKLIATSPSLERMTDLINKYFYSTTFYLEPKNDKEYSVYNKKGLLSDLIVVKKGGRFRFESK